MTFKEFPKGLITFIIILIVAFIFSVYSSLRPSANMIYFGKVFDGLPFKLYTLGLGFLHLLIAYGILKLRHWSFTSFTIFTAYFAITTIINLIITENDTLTEAGLRLSSFYFIQFLALFISTIMFLWLLKYRKKIIK